jgi:DNA gyrase subunit B
MNCGEGYTADQTNCIKTNQDYVKKIINNTSTDKIEVTRFKGLGEMDADELGTTTMEIGKRQIIKVNVEDVEEASRILNVLMGSNVGPRKEHIIEKSTARMLENNG